MENLFIATQRSHPVSDLFTNTTYRLSMCPCTVTVITAVISHTNETPFTHLLLLLFHSSVSSRVYREQECVMKPPPAQSRVAARTTTTTVTQRTLQPVLGS